MPQHWWAEAEPGQLLRLLPPSPWLGVRPPASVRTGVRWLGEGQDWPLPELGRGAGEQGGGAGDASARGLSPGQSLWAASDWPWPDLLSPGTPQGGDLPYLGPAAGRQARQSGFGLLVAGLSEWRSDLGAWGLLGWGCSTEVPSVDHALQELCLTFFCTAGASSGKFNSKKRRKQRDGACTPVSGKHPLSQAEEGGQQRAVREERKLGCLLSSSWPAA